MYLMKTVTEKSEMTKAPPFGPGVSPELAAQADRMEVWATKLSDPGPDHCRFLLKSADGEILKDVRIDG